VLSGPDVPGIHTCDTAATMRTMIEDAHHDLIMVGYALHNIQSLFQPIAEKFETIPGFKVIFCLDIGRPYGDTSLESEIIRRFINEFKERHWPWPKMPDIFYDPRSLETGQNAGHSSLHAKCIITDHKIALVTSANFTEAAQYRNIEAGVQIKHVPMVKRLAGYFEGLIDRRLILPCVY
jgi:phosphatidylserine/phosphatidylglycerophosphate/cardiolipin synthase-like enzyme